MLRVRRRLLWTPAQIRHIPTAYRFLTSPPASSARGNAQSEAENASIALPPPPRQDICASTDRTGLAFPDTTSAETISDTLPPISPSIESPAPSVSHHAPNIKDNFPKASPSISEDVAKRLRGWSTTTRAQLQQRSDQWAITALKRVSQLGGQLNQITGYEEIDALKRHVAAQEERIQIVRTAARQAKIVQEEAVAQRAKSQREVNDLLSRKSTWSDDDVGRFTRLVRQDHIYEQAEVTAKEAAAKAEDDVEKEFSALMRAILNRYHEEQVWSDKIRSASTYGSLAVLGLNVVVFLLATIFVEPWKRKRLAATFEKKVDEMDARNTLVISDGMAALHERLEKQEQALTQYSTAVAALTVPWSEVQPTTDDAAPSRDGIAISTPPRTEPAPPVDPVVPVSPAPSTWRDQVPSTWREWRVLVDQQATEHVLIAASSAAFFGGTVAGWFIRELRR